ncbi:MAG: aminopeptidase P family N-terminal domain-containing protein, partial [Bacteroidaceae bacterium]|nr:aminopeptidase P family N-terminal domain-containing protein [Bacteroidaceae bacterium]
MEQEVITQRVEALRSWMRVLGISAFIIPSTDPHASEYVPMHWASREWISGFNGSAGTAVVTLHDAALWTDSRYFLAAAEQLQHTPFQLMKERVEGTPNIAQWLCIKLQSGNIVGVDGRVNTICDINNLRELLQTKGIHLNLCSDPMEQLWNTRPSLPKDPIAIQPLKFAGEAFSSKLQRLKQKLLVHGADSMIISALDEIAWFLNLRGSDVHCNPVFVSYCLVSPDKVTLYVDRDKINNDISTYLKNNHVNLQVYEALESDLQHLYNCHILLTPQTNALITEAAAQNNTVIFVSSPVAEMKAIKNSTEIEGFRHAMLRDGVALVKFLRRLDSAVKAGGLTEIGVDRMLTDFRAEAPLFKDISFDTIAGYADHGAIVHYEVTPKTDYELQPHGFLLLDSGAQYQDGTTDITRTISLGEPSAEEKHIYTLVLKGHISLSRLKFPRGASGTQLDLSARYAMWQEGYNFGH